MAILPRHFGREQPPSGLAFVSVVHVGPGELIHLNTLTVVHNRLLSARFCPHPSIRAGACSVNSGTACSLIPRQTGQRADAPCSFLRFSSARVPGSTEATRNGMPARRKATTRRTPQVP